MCRCVTAHMSPQHTANNHTTHITSHHTTLPPPSPAATCLTALCCWQGAAAAPHHHQWPDTHTHTHTVCAGSNTQWRRGWCTHTHMSGVGAKVKLSVLPSRQLSAEAHATALHSFLTPSPTLVKTHPSLFSHTHPPPRSLTPTASPCQMLRMLRHSVSSCVC